jgi:hypothetical protein
MLLPSPARGHKQIESVSDIFIFGFPTFSVGVELEKASKQTSAVICAVSAVKITALTARYAALTWFLSLRIITLAPQIAASMGENMTNEDHARCAVLREQMKPLDDEMARIDDIRANSGLTEQEAARYRAVDGEYDQLFNELCDADPTIEVRILAGEIINICGPTPAS